MNVADAPQPGWYPDPEGGTRLRWWDGRDWRSSWRVRPPEAMLYGIDAPPGGESGGGGTSGAVQAGLDRAAAVTSGQATDAAAATAGAVATARTTRQEREEMIAEVRRIARQEVGHATEQLTQTARQATSSLETTLKGFVDEYAGTALTWIKRGVRIVVVLGLILFLLQAFGSVAQVRLLDWLGDRFDALFGIATVAPADLARGALPDWLTSWPPA